MSSIGGYTIDVFVTEDHTQEAEATDLPVEEGSNFTDHVRLKPGMLGVECTVSDAPQGDLAVTRGISDDGASAQAAPSAEARAFMTRLIEARQPVIVETSIKLYTEMVLLGIGENISVESGRAMKFRATFKAARIVKSERTRVPVASPRNAKKNRRGAVASKTVGEAGAEGAAAGAGPPLRTVQNQSLAAEQLHGDTYLTSGIDDGGVAADGMMDAAGFPPR